MGRNRSVITFKIQHAAFDFFVLSCVLLVYFLFVAQQYASTKSYIPYAVTTLGIWLFAIYFFGGYDFYRIFKIQHNFRLILVSCLVAVGISQGFSLIYPKQFSVLALNLYTLAFVPVFYIFRLAFTKIVSSHLPTKNVLIYGAGWAGEEILRVINGAKFLKYNVIGFLDDDGDKTGNSFQGLEIIGNGDRLEEFVERYDVDLVVFSITRVRGERVLTAKSMLHELDVDTFEMPDLYERITGRIPVLHVNNTWHDFYVSLKHREPYWIYRLYNISLAFFFSIVFMPVIPFVVLAIKLTSRGPVLYAQKRVGRKERPFTLYKFRSMKIDAEKHGAQWAVKNDPRMTSIGGFLRASRLDEIPQLINVFRGEMNFVGPRPERPEFVKELNRQIPFYRSRHQVAPGLTGWAQVRMGYASSVQDSLEKLQYDLYYIKNRGIFFDLLILIKTIQVVLGRKGT
jgi:exopolysaccharide biosynthesis polyprenyl glycosylphosphotransferase